MFDWARSQWNNIPNWEFASVKLGRLLGLVSESGEFRPINRGDFEIFHRSRNAFVYVHAVVVNRTDRSPAEWVEWFEVWPGDSDVADYKHGYELSNMS